MTVALLLVTAVLMIVGFRNTEGEGGNRRMGKLFIAAGFGVIVIAGLTVYSTDIQGGMLGVGIASLLCLIYLVQGLRTAKTKS